MTRFSEDLVPSTPGDVLDVLMSIIGRAPRFEVEWFSEAGIDEDFEYLDRGLTNIEERVGLELTAALKAQAREAKACFLEDPEDSTGRAKRGYGLINTIYENICAALKARRVH